MMSLHPLFWMNECLFSVKYAGGAKYARQSVLNDCCWHWSVSLSFIHFQFLGLSKSNSIWFKIKFKHTGEVFSAPLPFYLVSFRWRVSTPFFWMKRWGVECLFSVKYAVEAVCKHKPEHIMHCFKYIKMWHASHWHDDVMHGLAFVHIGMACPSSIFITLIICADEGFSAPLPFLVGWMSVSSLKSMH